MKRIALVLAVLAGCGDDAAVPADGSASDAAIDAPGESDAEPAQPLPALPLRAQSRWILDANGHRFKLASVNWYGAEEKDHVVAGLERADLGQLARLLRSQGFNSVRLPWSNEMVEQNPVVADSVVAANPALRGLHALEVYDAVVGALAHEGLLVILDNHTSRADWCCSDIDGNGLWYTPDYPESSWLADWAQMAARYANQPAVVGADLRNEPRSIILPATCSTCGHCPCAQSTGCTCTTAVWGGSDPQTDWRGAATRGATAVIGANPNLLVIVEGVSYAGDLGGAYSNPILLGAHQDRLVYSAHDYSFFHPTLVAQANPQYQDLKTLLGDNWGFLLTQNQPFTGPVWVSEFGTCHQDATCLDGTTGIGWWFASFRRYLGEADIDWSYWAWNGTQARGTGRTFGAEEGYGVLDTTWDAAALPALLGDLQMLEPATQGP